MSFDDGADISVADIGTYSSDLFCENSITVYEAY